MISTTSVQLHVAFRLCFMHLIVHILRKGETGTTLECVPLSILDDELLTQDNYRNYLRAWLDRELRVTN